MRLARFLGASPAKWRRNAFFSGRRDVASLPLSKIAGKTRSSTRALAKPR
jgi:hypothetical protein